MATERQKFMYELSLKEFETLKAHIGKKLKFNYILNGVEMSATGTLLEVNPFKSIVFTGGEIPFVSREKILREVVTGEGVALYDRTFMIPKNFSNLTDIDRIKLALMGASQEVKQNVANQTLSQGLA
ncbi:MAG: hypothetical protein IKT27_01075 [Clostridia bacterium]|nr:hypothetical protein [Clostridia bacterium]